MDVLNGALWITGLVLLTLFKRFILIIWRLKLILVAAYMLTYVLGVGIKTIGKRLCDGKFHMNHRLAGLQQPWACAATAAGCCREWPAAAASHQLHQPNKLHDWPIYLTRMHISSFLEEWGTDLTFWKWTNLTCPVTNGMHKAACLESKTCQTKTRECQNLVISKCLAKI